jgi:hypothetical protein
MLICLTVDCSSIYLNWRKFIGVFWLLEKIFSIELNASSLFSLGLENEFDCEHSLGFFLEDFVILEFVGEWGEGNWI